MSKQTISHIDWQLKRISSLYENPDFPFTSKERFNDLLKLLFHEKPKSLDCILLTLDNLVLLKPIIDTICKEDKYKRITNRFDFITPLLTEWTQTKRNELKKHLYWSGKKFGKNTNASFRGLTADQPRFVTLGHRSEIAGNNEFILQLQAQILVADIIIRIIKPPKGYISFRPSALCAIRVLATKKKCLRLGKPLSHFLPNDRLCPSEYHAYLYASINQSEHIDSCYRFISYADNLLPKKAPPKKRKINNWDEDYIDEDYIDEDYIDEEKPTEDINKKLFYHIEGSNSGPYRSGSGNPGKEIPKGYQIVFPTGEEDDEDRLFDEINDATDYVSRDNQNFEFMWHQLNQHDMCILLWSLHPSESETAITQFQYEHRYKTVKLSDLEKAALCILLWTGMSFSRMSKVLLAKNSPLSLPDTDYYINDSGTIRLISHGPQLRTKPDPKLLKQSIETSNHICHRLPKVATQVINTYLLSLPPSSSPSLFAKTPQELRGVCQTAISRIRRKNLCRLTLTRISRQLESHLSRMKGSDVSAASITLGKEIWLARTKMHYAAFDSSDLQFLYQKACDEIFCDVGLNDQTTEIDPFAKSLHLGTPYRPRLEPIQNLVAKLKAQIKKSKPGARTSVAKIMTFHNLYTEYTALMISFSSAYRAVRNPGISLSAHDEKTSLTIIRDKDTSDFYHTRLICLPEKCTQQLLNYKRHQDKLNELISGGKFPVLPNKKLQPSDLYYYVKPKSRKNYKPKIIRPKDLKTSFEFNKYFLRLNACRQLYKSETQENLLPVDSLEAFLGHWFAGEEPWTRFSALHPYDYKEVLLTDLTRRLDQLGFEPLEGCI